MNFFFIAEFLAVMTAIGFATGDVVARLALRHASPFMGAFMTSVIGFLLFGSVLWAVGPGAPVNLTGIGWFLLAGLAQPAFGFITLMKAFERVGVARTAAIMGTSPLFGVSIAVLFLGERPGLSVAAGTALIVFGVILLSLEEGTKGAMKWKDMGYPFLTALLFGLVPVLRKSGLNHIPSPLFGMTVASFSGLIILTACARMFPAGRGFTKDKRGIRLYAASGAIHAVFVFVYFLALERGTVSVVIPLLFTYPLFILPMVHFVLRTLERISLRLVLGAGLIVSGAIAITGFR